MKRYYNALLIPLPILFLMSCNSNNEYGINYGQPNTINLSLNGTSESYTVKQRYAIYLINGSNNTIMVSADTANKSVSMNWELQGGRTFTPGTYTTANVNTYISRKEYFDHGRFDWFYHISGPQAGPLGSLKGLTHQLIIDEFEIGPQIAPDQYTIKKLRANFKSQCKEKLDTDTIFQSKINLLSGYIDISQ